MADRVTILLLSVLAAQCCVSAAHQQCTTDPAVGVFQPMYSMYRAHVEAMNAHLIVAKHLLTCVGAVNACIKEEPMGIEDGSIPDSNLTASSIWDSRFGPDKARLNSEGEFWGSSSLSPGSWSPARADSKPWIQVDFQETVHITGVITQVRHLVNQWVIEYQVAFSQDASIWTNVADGKGAAITFEGHTNRYRDVTNRFPAVVSARYLRIYPTAWYAHPSMRFEVIGCAPTS